jgi:hypothetical protein
MTARHIEHDLHKARCGRGTVHLAARPDGCRIRRPRSARTCALGVYRVIFGLRDMTVRN